MSVVELADAAEAVLAGRRRALLGIAGAPGAGKTTVTLELIGHLAARLGAERVAHVPMDGFHLADAQLERIGLRDRKGAPDTFDAAGYAATLHRIRSQVDRPVYVPGFERDLEQPIAAALVVLPAARLIVTEGNYLLLDTPRWRAVRRQLDEVWFVGLDDVVRIERLIARHVRFGKSPAAAREWVARSDAANARLVLPTARFADRRIVNGTSGEAGEFRFGG